MSVNTECIKHNADQAAKVLKALSNSRRLLVLCALCNGEKCVGELEKIVEISQSALSQHLAKLREDHLVVTRRDAQTIYYSLANPYVKELIWSLNKIFSDLSLQSALIARASPDKSSIA